MSLTPQPGEARTQEVVVALEILQSLGLRSFNPSVTACPGCGRTTSTTFQELAKQIDDYLRAQMPVLEGEVPRGGEDEGRGDGLASSTARAKANTPTSASACRAPAKPPPRRSSSMARRP